MRKSYSEETHVNYDSAGISFRRARNPSSAVAHPIGRLSLSLTFRTSKNFLGVEHGVHASEDRRRKRKRKGPPSRFPSDFEESWSLCRVRCSCISDYLVENRGTRLQLKALDMRKGRESFAGEIHRRCRRRGSVRGGGRGRVRSLSPVQTFTSYETTGELPVLGTGCR